MDIVYEDDAGIMDYRQNEIVVVDNGFNNYTVTLTFSFRETNETDNVIKVSAQTIAEQWCQKWSAAEPAEDFSYVVDVITADWVEPTVLKMTIETDDIYGEPATIETVADFFKNNSLEDGPYEASGANDYFWIVTQKFVSSLG